MVGAASKDGHAAHVEARTVSAEGQISTGARGREATDYLKRRSRIDIPCELVL